MQGSIEDKGWRGIRDKEEAVWYDLHMLKELDRDRKIGQKERKVQSPTMKM